MKKIYLAGPDVFELNAFDIGKNYEKLCLKYGYQSLFPLDNKVNFNQHQHKVAKDIYMANIKFIQEADIIIANLNCFRGKEADSGTVWECGYGFAIGKPIYGYMDKTNHYLEKFDENEKKTIEGLFVDNKEKIIENFLHPINLMIACSTTEIIEGNLEDVLKTIK